MQSVPSPHPSPFRPLRGRGEGGGGRREEMDDISDCKYISFYVLWKGLLPGLQFPFQIS